MAFQPIEEKIAERRLITDFAEKIKAKVVKLQEDDDDGETDGFIEYEGKPKRVEARRKGYPNHRGRTFFFSKGWETNFLINDGGIFLNELTIRKSKDKGFIFVVDIMGDKRAAVINSSRVDELLKQPRREMKSTNSGVMQSVKTLPLAWFKLKF